MRNRRDFLLAASFAAAIVAPALAQTPGGGKSSPGGIPDFSGIWWHPSLPGIEPLSSGPTSLRNLSRDKGVSNYGQLVGDWHNPILQPWAADVVRKVGDLAKMGITYPSPANQCWPMQVPFIYKNFALQMLQQPGEVTLLYEQNMEFRKVRLNQSHPANPTPSWYGDSVGHYEGDTLVVDTIGQKRGPFSMIDLYGTPYSEALHVVERYRLLSYEEAKEGLDRDEKENTRVARDSIDRNYRGKHLQIFFTVEDPNVFTGPWSATVTFGRGSDAWPETLCAENHGAYYHGEHSEPSKVPTALRPDF